MGWVVQAATKALQARDLPAIGHLMNIHQLFQEKMGTSIAGNENLIEAALGAGALGAKISGSGRGGVIIALVEPSEQAVVAGAIDAAGGRSYIVTTGAEGVRLETPEMWSLSSS
jgi:mevalonate kinase